MKNVIREFNPCMCDFCTFLIIKKSVCTPICHLIFVIAWYMHSQSVNLMDMYINSVARTSIKPYCHNKAIFFPITLSKSVFCFFTWNKFSFDHLKFTHVPFIFYNKLFFSSLALSFYVFDGFYQTDHSSSK